MATPTPIHSITVCKYPRHGEQYRLFKFDGSITSDKLRPIKGVASVGLRLREVEITISTDSSWDDITPQIIEIIQQYNHWDKVVTHTTIVGQPWFGPCPGFNTYGGAHG